MMKASDSFRMRSFEIREREQSCPVAVEFEKYAGPIHAAARENGAGYESSISMSRTPILYF